MTHTRAAWVLGGLLLLIPLLTVAQDAPTVGDSSVRLQGSGNAGTRQRDTGSMNYLLENAGVNKRDSKGTTLTPADMGQSPADIDLTRQIRRLVLNDPSLSTYAHNVKITVRNGQVTLRGPVRSAEEKAAVEEKASLVAGRGNVKNEVDVAPGRGE